MQQNTNILALNWIRTEFRSNKFNSFSIVFIYLIVPRYLKKYPIENGFSIEEVV